MSLSRRDFLRRTGWIAGGLTVVASSGCSFIPPLPSFGQSSVSDSLAWVQLQKDGRFRFYLPRAEMGQGISTTFTHVVAAELYVNDEQVDCQHQSTAFMAPCQMTVGSQSIENYYLLVARAAASLRETIKLHFATTQNHSPANIALVQGGFKVGTIFTSYQDIAKTMTSVIVPLDLTEDVQLRAQESTASATKPQHSARNRRIVMGDETFSRDINLPNLHFGAIARPPHLGARLLGFNQAETSTVPGVVAVVTSKNQVGVVAKTPLASTRALNALKPQWSELTPTDKANIHRSLDVDEFVSASALDHTVVSEGSIGSGRSSTDKNLSSRFDSPMIAHAAMEPRSGVAFWQPNRGDSGVCEIWTASQDPWMVQATAAKALNLGKEQVQVHNHSIGGGFGGRVLCQASVEAAWLSKETGLPVKVQWSREDEFRHNYVGPQFSSRIDAGLDTEGNITYWHQRAVGAPILISSMFIPENLHWLANLIADPGTQRGMKPPYQIENIQVEFADERLPMPTGPWRGLGAAPNTFAVEVAMDELAKLARLDAISFRLKNLDNPRLSQCLEVLKQQLSTGIEEYGIAATTYKNVTHVAIAARVVSHENQLTITELICVQDCGKVLSPVEVHAQIEGNLIWGIGMAMKEEFKLEHGIASTTNFDQYQLPRQSDIPDIKTVLVESTEPPSGAAEAALAPTAAAIVNAVYAHTGIRHYRLPIRLP